MPNRQMVLTFFRLRIGIAIISFAFPLILWLIGWLNGIPLQGSMSAYYHACLIDPDISTCIKGASARDWYVGVLFGVGVLLHLYKGYNWKENWALNFACYSSIGVALIPMGWPVIEGQSFTESLSLHGFSAVMFFIFMAYVCLFRSEDTLKEMNDEKLRLKFRNLYRGLSFLMVASPFAAWAISIIYSEADILTFLVESFAILVIALFWLVKTKELSLVFESEPTITEAISGLLDRDSRKGIEK